MIVVVGALLEATDLPEATVIRPRTAPWLLFVGVAQVGGRGGSSGL
jgi:hypothetical protein